MPTSSAASEGTGEEAPAVPVPAHSSCFCFYLFPILFFPSPKPTTPGGTYSPGFAVWRLCLEVQPAVQVAQAAGFGAHV